MFKTQVTITGNLVGEPEMRATKTGEPLASMRVAVNARRKDPESGAWVNYATSFYNVSAFNRMAINALNCLHKGEPVLVIGELKVREYTGQHGETQRSVDITAEHIGHDLSQGRSQFRKQSQPTLDRFADDPGVPAGAGHPPYDGGPLQPIDDEQLAGAQPPPADLDYVEVEPLAS
ncbi:single-stranded DNA-binding protein [Luteipulveratus halotolerans]|uniref:single-stranded DNA-binding protein n=1 Tax=Luteipulveratus halotolerans TaxID=1631356 RepID=UPI00067FE5BE|nr:single-stranded DNA-binding protein [Luteipulveratus halotolerans]